MVEHAKVSRAVQANDVISPMKTINLIDLLLITCIAVLLANLMG
jgi:hypothetical protein